MKYIEFSDRLKVPSSRGEMIWSLASVFVSGWVDLPDNVKEQDEEVTRVAIKFYGKNNTSLIAIARDLGVVEN